MTASALRVAVVGAGIMGTSTAAELSARGTTVRVFERARHGHTSGSSHGATRGFRLGYADPDYAELAIRARQRWKAWEQRLSRGFLTPAVRVEHGVSTWTRALSQTYELQSIPYERLDPGSASRAYPGLTFQGDVLLQRDAGVIDAAGAWWELRRYAERHGCEFRDNTEVVGLEERGRTVDVITDDQSTFTADVVVIAAGAWAPELAPGLLPELTVTEEQVLHFGPARGSVDRLVEWWPNIAHRTTDGRTFWSVATPGLGAKVSFHRSGTSIDPRHPNGPVGSTATSIADHVATWMPALDPVPVDHSTCLYTNAPDDRLLLGRRGRVVVVSACSGHGFKFAPLVGEAAADTAMGSVCDGDLDATNGLVTWMRATAHEPIDRRTP